jgi:O-methyltransferase involved in polyketide biosynthesis
LACRSRCGSCRWNSETELLPAADLRSAAPALFSRLGVSMYLSRAAVADTPRYVASFGRGSGIVFGLLEIAGNAEPAAASCRCFHARVAG